jgi:8-amino-7-oxononanoate synthase
MQRAREGFKKIGPAAAWREMEESLAALAAADLVRRPVTVDSPAGPRVTVGGRELVCLCGNDYLSLAADAAVTSAAAAALRRWGVGAGASRLVSGTTRLHVELEAQLAAFKGTEAALVTSTGWAANHVAVAALVGAGDLVLCDKLNHASIIDACLAAGARLRTYPHRDTRRLAAILERHRHEYRRCLIVTDSLFSMDGDLAPLAELAELKERFDALLVIDEAHATGVLGAGGRGAAELLGVEDRIDAVVGTLSKALGALGGFVAGRRQLIDTIVNTGRAFIYTTALPPAICAAAMESLRIVADQPGRRRRLLELAGELRGRLASAGLIPPSSGPATPIIPILIGQAGKALRVSRALFEAGFLVPAIRPPTVPRNASRLRVSLCATHDPQDLARFAEKLQAILA